MLSRQRNRPHEGACSGTLHVVATPIGHLGDITLRALETLGVVDLIAAEDTRHTRKLLTHYDVHKPLVSYHSRNSRKRGPELLGRLQSGESLALVTDAGTPGISDPGVLLVNEALEEGIPVSVIPGPSAVISALVVSGLPTHTFAFLGFPPVRGTGRRRFFETQSNLPMTLVLYESPKRLLRTLQDILALWGNRRMAVARELTKLYEEVFRGSVSEAMEHFAGETRGEVTLVVAGCEAPDEREREGPDWREELRRLLEDANFSVREAADAVAGQCGLSRRLVYQEALRIRGR